MRLYPDLLTCLIVDHSGASGYTLMLQQGQIAPVMPEWRNWQTRTTQNRVGNPRVGSTPTFGTITSTSGGHWHILVVQSASPAW